MSVTHVTLALVFDVLKVTSALMLEILKLELGDEAQLLCGVRRAVLQCYLKLVI